MLQGLSSSLFHWDDTRQCFHLNSGIYVTHLSQTSLYRILDQLTYAATCLQLVDIVVNKIEKSKSLTPPTLRAFACSVRTWLRRMRDVALKEEVKVNSPDGSTAVTILGLSSSLSRARLGVFLLTMVPNYFFLYSLCSGAEYLFQIVHGAIPPFYYELDAYVPAADIAVHILNHLYVKLNEVCLVQGGEEDAYRMLLYILVGSLLPYIESLDSWLFQGTLDDPFDEMFFVANKNISIEEAEFWEKSCQPRLAMNAKLNFVDFASEYLPSAKEKKDTTSRAPLSFSNMDIGKQENRKDFQVCPFFIKDIAKAIISAGKSLQLIRHAPTRSVPANDVENGSSIAGLTLSEVFCVSLTALIGDGDHIAYNLWPDDNYLIGSIEESQSKKFWQKLLNDTLTQKRNIEGRINSHNLKGLEVNSDGTYCPENPALTVCHGILQENRDSWSSLNIYQAFNLPPLNDECLRQAIFSDNRLAVNTTDFTSGFQFGELERLRFLEDAKMLGVMLPFPTLLPSFQEDLQISKVLPFQNNCTLPSRILSWVQNVDPISDLLQHFLSVIFNKLDKGESLDDDFELNTILQLYQSSEMSVLVKTNQTAHLFLSRLLAKVEVRVLVSWPLELIANLEAMKKYNQVMSFLLKVKRAKFVLDKVRRWMWKDRGTATTKHKRHYLLEQKLLHFVDAFHQYVMDRWGLIASRINSILGLALDFYSVQQTLSSGGAISAIKARCVKEMERIEKQFDDCMAFLLRILSVKLNVGQFPHLAALVTRINYNSFYMSDGGVLVTGTSRPA
ncbi:gamma-tubulin complex component 5 [Phtheirospermum japonicum]|uniref:Gamma-tubulin complex component n=1 Tax=Phtheirospermum japonicum TaxID=374723 RepID=A0A830CJR1_9LAMI|nr:gamma-tubulin complex component 5 [Phtheirospermum japonicum]